MLVGHPSLDASSSIPIVFRLIYGFEMFSSSHIALNLHILFEITLIPSTEQNNILNVAISTFIIPNMYTIRKLSLKKVFY